LLFTVREEFSFFAFSLLQPFFLAFAGDLVVGRTFLPTFQAHFRRGQLVLVAQLGERSAIVVASAVWRNLEVDGRLRSLSSRCDSGLVETGGPLRS
jgi:hypothetical protein